MSRMSELHSENQVEKEPCPTCDSMSQVEKLNRCAYTLGMASGGVMALLDVVKTYDTGYESLLKLKEFLMKQCNEIFYEGKG